MLSKFLLDAHKHPGPRAGATELRLRWHSGAVQRHLKILTSLVRSSDWQLWAVGLFSWLPSPNHFSSPELLGGDECGAGDLCAPGFH